ncbi:two-component sensor histidine kinase [Agaricicola taiwanensis]|uniref:histidine kinase n=1 Tax=Agaricicola taiwanensis TaxID=591372 RepID=A0A8J2VMV0_9RHOB|nr:PAS domain-containing sensor histidine kinase [Agaricicola taiwanensis]GGE32716.1 two-component sensor histidine kinase [Agaricicola taiwanensis]
MGQAGRWRSRSLKALLALAPLPYPAAAQSADFALHEPGNLIWVVIFAGVAVTAVTSSLMLVRYRSRALLNERTASSQISALRARLDRAEVLASTEPQIVIIYEGRDSEPEITGSLPEAQLPPGKRILGFGAWLQPHDAAALEHAVEVLRTKGIGFRLDGVTRFGDHVLVDGRVLGAQALVRIRDVTGEARARAELQSAYDSLMKDMERTRALLDGLPHPSWMRDGQGNPIWVNKAYASAVEVPEIGKALALELFDETARSAAARSLAHSGKYRERVAAVARGERRIFDMFATSTGAGSAGLAVDVSDVEAVKAEVERLRAFHRRTLDELSTGVATFAADGTLVFHNQAYRQMWRLDPAFLDSEPTDTQILERLRADRQLPEQADFRVWREKLHEAYRAIENIEHWWHLPDGRSVRVVQTPNPEGGITYLFDDVTERIKLESRFNALSRVQNETLDHLREGVVVFGTDGRLKLWNPAFAALWGIPAERLQDEPHAADVFAACHPRDENAQEWARLKGTVTSLAEQRTPVSARIELTDNTVVDVSTVPLPDGATLVAFTDVTAQFGIERALREKNEALEATAQLKSDFVKNVSYELRSPLTNIIGFTQLLGDATIGPLNDKQHEYAEHILASSAALLTIINDILDLATIDAGAMELDLAEVDIRETMAAAAEGVRDRLAEATLTLDIAADRNIGRFTADGRRVRQVLFNLLSNAIGFSPNGGTVTLSAMRENDAVVFSVTDRGPGIPEEMIDRMFDRFESRTNGSRHRGVGLGLPLVRSLVELHGGTVEIMSAQNKGTTVICRFPISGVANRVAAE